MNGIAKAAQTSQITVLLLLMALAAAPAEARFQAEDADQIDPEERLSSETYNDKVSYRFPLAWDRLWEAHDVGYRVSAGSLNVNRFDYVEDVKLYVEGEGPVSLAFVQSRREDILEQRTEREVWLGWRIAGPLKLFMMGDGGTFKEYGDVGGGVGYRVDRSKEVRAYYWSVDHFYDTKKSDSTDEQSRKSDSAGLAADWRFTKDLHLALAYEADHPLRWKRPSRGYVYEYARQTLDYRVELGLADAWSGFVSGNHERKEESKTWTNGLPQAKAMSRRVDMAEIGAMRESADGDLTTGIQLISRDALYRFEADPRLKPTDYEEEAGPPRSSRNEGCLYATWYFPYAAPRHYLQVGAFLNEMRLREEGRAAATELKAQLAWDYRITEKARVFLNTSWDLDQVQKDYPFDDRSPNPWGGGDIQFVAVF